MAFIACFQSRGNAKGFETVGKFRCLFNKDYFMQHDKERDKPCVEHLFPERRIPMNALLGIAKITSNRKIRKWCFIKRGQQLQKQWAKEKTTTLMVAIESTDEDWFLGWELN
jgi:hypothetical protein